MSNAEIIKDKFGSTLGKIVKDGSSRLKAVDRLGSTLGYYYIREDVTKDRLGRTLAKGNTLSALIYNNR